MSGALQHGTGTARLVLVASMLGLLAGERAIAGGDDVAGVIPFSKEFRGLLFDASDSDRIGFDDIVGSRIAATVARDGGGTTTLALVLEDDQGAVLATGQPTANGSKSSLSEFTLPETGRYYFRVSGTGAAKYALTFSGKPPKKPAIPDGAVAAPAELEVLLFSARAGSKLKGSITRDSGTLVPRVVEIVAPGGALLPIAESKQIESSKKSVEFSGFVLPDLGEYRIRLTGEAGTTGGYQAKLMVEPPKKEKGIVYEAGHPALDGVEPFTLEEVSIARGVRRGSGEPIELESAFTFGEVDPLTGFTDVESIAPLYAGAPKGAAGFIAFNLDDLLAPPIVPRDAVLVMRFTREIDASTLALDELGRLTPSSPIQVSAAGKVVPIEVSVFGKLVALDPVVGDESGFPASPLLVDGNGVGVASAQGVGAITLATAGLRATNGAPYEPREDLLGSVDAGGAPIPFNPGNAKLDTFLGIDVSGQSVGYGGFLPSERAPRIVRQVTIEGAFAPDFLAPALGDIQGSKSLAIVLDAPLDVSANDGKGAYAGGVLRLRPGASDEEVLRITKHGVVALSNGKFRNEFQLATKIVQPLAAPTSKGPADDYSIERLEYFEPDPTNPIDPESFDPADPDLDTNSEFSNFVVVKDRNGEPQAIDDPLDPIDPLSTFTVRFDRPMDADSFRAYESFRIELDPLSAIAGHVVLGRIVRGDHGRTMTFEPGREIQFGPNAGSFEPIPMTPTPGAFRFVMTSVPDPKILSAMFGGPATTQFLALGVRGVTDVSGRPLALPPSLLSSNQPYWQLTTTVAIGSSTTAISHGAVVHRFQGQALTGQTGNGNTGVRFQDVPPAICGSDGNLYGPRIADVNLFSNGFLSGAPVAFFQKIHDDFNPPPATLMNPFPFGVSTPFSGFAVLGGARMQHVYRAVDASPDYEGLGGTLLDLRGVAFAPHDGAIVNTILPDVSIHAGHSAVVPDTDANGGIPQFALSGLGGGAPAFRMGGHHQTLGDTNTPYDFGSYNAKDIGTGQVHFRKLVHGVEKSGTTTDFYDGRAVVLDANDLFSPPLSPDRAYLRFPREGFDRPFPYDNGALDVQNYPAGVSFGMQLTPRHHSLLLEYRVRVVDPISPPATTNAFTFSVGILSSALPRFRVFTMGVACKACCIAVNCVNNCGVILNPPMNGLPGGAGDPLNPDAIVNAVGPDVSAPGLACFCHGFALNPTSCAPGFSDQTSVNPPFDLAALGANPSGSNNFGDNSRYFVVFDYVKRESRIRSPFVRARPFTITNPIWLEPIFSPPLSAIPAGSTLDVRFRASATGAGQFEPATFVAPEDIGLLNGAGRPYIQFEAVFVANTSSQLVPALEELVIPFVAQ